MMAFRELSCVSCTLPMMTISGGIARGEPAPAIGYNDLNEACILRYHHFVLM